MTAKLALLVSGRGSNMQAIVNACEQGQIPAEVCLVASDNPNAGGLAWAQSKGIATAVVKPADHPNREAADAALASVIEQHGEPLLLLAGYMRILSEHFVTQFTGRALNIHPSLLPKYKGLNTHARALAAKDSLAGATVHFVSPALDSGPSVIQAQVAIETKDDADRLAKKVLHLEHQIFPKAACWLAEGRLTLNQGIAYLDNQKLMQPVMHS